jgi:hypothetical protein
LEAFHILRHSFPIFFKLTKIVVVQMPGLMEDELKISNPFFHEIKVEKPPQ